LVSSVLVVVPSGDWVVVFSVDLTVPSLLVLLLSVLETVRSYPTNRNDNAKVDVATHITAIQFVILCFIDVLPSLARATAAPCWSGGAQLALSPDHQKRYKRPAINHLRGKADKAMEGPWPVRASLLKSDLALAGYAKCTGRQCKMHVSPTANREALVTSLSQ